MGRPKADLTTYSPWGAYPLVTPMPPPSYALPVVPREGVQTFSDLAIWALQFPQVQAYCGLYTNVWTPTPMDHLSNYTFATAPSIFPKLLPTATFIGIDINGRAVWEWPPLDFVADGPGLPVQVWGYAVYCTDPVTKQQVLLWASRFVNSFAFVNPGDTLPLALATSFAQC
jgi:hypothetical protein